MFQIWFLIKRKYDNLKKLQKLTYYAEAWANALLGEGILSDTAFQAWVHGPVSPELWHDYKEYGWNEIEQLKPNDEKFNKNILELLECCLNHLWGVNQDMN